eukprot:131974_1
MELPQDVNILNTMAQRYLTPGGPDDIDIKNDQDDDKKAQSTDTLGLPPTLNRQITAYCFSKYRPSKLKELVATVFEEHFDKDNNNDIDIKEFKDALKDLGINMSDNRMEKLFQLINGTDGDLSDLYITKDNLCDFIGNQYYNQPTQQRYQEQLLRAISPKFEDDTPPELNKLLSLATIAKETQAMQKQMELLLSSETQKVNKKLEFQEQLFKRKTSKQNFCQEQNAENWDEYEVAYWIGVILGYEYCMKRFFDEKIVGKMLLFDVDTKMLIHLKLNQMHLNTFKRRLESLRKVALKDMFEEEERKKKLEIEEKERRSSVFLEYNTMNNIHIDSDTKYLEEEQKTEIQKIQLDATKNESKLMYEINELNKKITCLTNDKLELIEKVNDIKQEYEDKISVLETQFGGKDGEKKSLKHDISLLKQKNIMLKQQNEELMQEINRLKSATNSGTRTPSVSNATLEYKLVKTPRESTSTNFAEYHRTPTLDFDCDENEENDTYYICDDDDVYHNIYDEDEHNNNNNNNNNN